MILVVAPYTFNSESSNINLGASKKIRFILSSLAKLSNHIILVNSAHNNSSNNTSKVLIRDIYIDEIKIIEIVPPTYSVKSFGKFINLFQIDSIIKQLPHFGRIELVWFYNAYAFEMIFAKKIKRYTNAKLVLEFEDWHFARSRRLNPKPIVDFFFWRKAAGLFNRVYVVNSELKNLSKRYSKDIRLLPGIVPKQLNNISVNSAPFQSASYNIGYFGGLNAEKGANIVIGLVNSLPDNYVIHVTGLGHLQDEFVRLSLKYPNKLKYYGLVSDEILYSLIAKCDILLNPHKPIDYLGNGIFPFKVVEAISTFRLLISTNLKFDGFDHIGRGVMFSDYDVESFNSSILGSKAFFYENYLLIHKSAVLANEFFGEDSFTSSLNELL